MHRRFLAVTVLAVTVLFSQGGGSLIAAFCPHLTSIRASCHTNVSEEKVSHDHIDQIDGMVMGETDSIHSMDEPIANANPDPGALAVGQPVGWCPHCSVHAPTTLNAVSPRGVEPSKRSGGVLIPDAAQPEVTAEESFAAFLTSRAHGPPDVNTPRHILLNVYRI
jgi:hypothetical protein